MDIPGDLVMPAREMLSCVARSRANAVGRDMTKKIGMRAFFVEQRA